MMNPEDIINEVHKLPLPQQKEVLETLTKELNRPPPEYVENDDLRLQEALFAAGLINEIKPRRDGKMGDFTPIKIKGKPLSETLIEDRR
jgi:hypothetical protein